VVVVVVVVVPGVVATGASGAIACGSRCRRGRGAGCRAWRRRCGCTSGARGRRSGACRRRRGRGRAAPGWGRAGGGSASTAGRGGRWRAEWHGASGGSIRSRARSSSPFRLPACQAPPQHPDGVQHQRAALAAAEHRLPAARWAFLQAAAAHVELTVEGGTVSARPRREQGVVRDGGQAAPGPTPAQGHRRRPRAPGPRWPRREVGRGGGRARGRPAAGAPASAP
jgi:hypothetical protein